MKNLRTRDTKFLYFSLFSYCSFNYAIAIEEIEASTLSKVINFFLFSTIKAFFLNGKLAEINKNEQLLFLLQ